MSTWILAALFLRACLIATHPFYAASDIRADDRVVGTYRDLDNGIEATVTRAGARGHYRVVLRERGYRSLYAVVLFRAGPRTFADISAEKVAVVAPPDNGVAPATQLLRQATAAGCHIALRLEPQADGFSAWLPATDALDRLWALGIKRRVDNNLISVLTEPTSRLRQLLARFGDDPSFFAQEFYIAKTPIPSPHQLPTRPRP